MVDRMNDGTYFVLVSETRRPATIYTSKLLDGRWAKLGTMSFVQNGFNVDVAEGGELHSNLIASSRTLSRLGFRFGISPTGTDQ